MLSPTRTPIAKRSTPETDAAARAPPRPRPTYSEQPLCLVDESALSASRFLNPGARRLAYRDASGRVNLHLCQHSLTVMDPAVDDEVARNNLVAWERHARRAIACRPSDENRTLNDLAAEEEEAEREREAMPLSQRKPKRVSAAARHGEETLVVLDAPERHERRRHRALRECILEEDGPTDDDDGSRSTASSSSSAAMRLAPGTVTMQRRLFRAPKPDDEPSVDLLYLRTLAEDRKRKQAKKRAAVTAAAGGRGRALSSSSLEEASSGEEDVYEVEAILKEDFATNRFLIRWEGYGPDGDTWEPEEHVAPRLVSAFRDKRRLEASNAGDDYMMGRAKQLWCATCEQHRPADCFSSNQRRLAPAARCCLNHHYRVGAGTASARPSAATSLVPRERAPLERSPHGGKSPMGGQSPMGGKTPVGSKRGRDESSPAGPPLLPKRLAHLPGEQYSPRKFTLPELTLSGGSAAQ